MSTESRMQRLVNDLNAAAKSYYSGSEESVLTDAQYDRELAKLIDLERQEGYKLATSPTLRVGYSDDLNKVQHHSPILSLKSTKSVDELLYFLGEKEGVLSWKLDGISIVLYYVNGQLDKAVSRGDGLYGSDITINTVLMQNVPTHIDPKGLTIIRGEGCISIKDFEKIKLTENGLTYRNPRNLAAGLVNTTTYTNPLIRHMAFIAHSVILLDEHQHKHAEQLNRLSELGFYVVPHKKVANYMLKHEIDVMSNGVDTFPYPVDGLVLVLNSLALGEKLGITKRYPRDTMAFKWSDASVLTKVKGVKWSVSATGLITPVVNFEPVELEGTTVRQANLHTLKGFEALGIGKGDTIEVFKANKIIPEVRENLTRSATEDYPSKCPVCKHDTTVVVTSKTRKLYCYHCGTKLF